MDVIEAADALDQAERDCRRIFVPRHASTSSRSTRPARSSSRSCRDVRVADDRAGCSTRAGEFGLRGQKRYGRPTCSSARSRRTAGTGPSAVERRTVAGRGAGAGPRVARPAGSVSARGCARPCAGAATRTARRSSSSARRRPAGGASLRSAGPTSRAMIAGQESKTIPKENTMDEETPVLDTLAAMTAASIENSNLGNRELMLTRIAALAAVDAPAISYLMNVGAAADSGLTVEDVQGILSAVAPIIGTARTVVRRGEHHRGPRLRDRRDRGRARGRARGHGGRGRGMSFAAGRRSGREPRASGARAREAPEAGSARLRRSCRRPRAGATALAVLWTNRHRVGARTPAAALLELGSTPTGWEVGSRNKVAIRAEAGRDRRSRWSQRRPSRDASVRTDVRGSGRRAMVRLTAPRDASRPHSRDGPRGRLRAWLQWTSRSEHPPPHRAPPSPGRRRADRSLPCRRRLRRPRARCLRCVPPPLGADDAGAAQGDRGRLRRLPAASGPCSTALCGAGPTGAARRAASATRSRRRVGSGGGAPRELRAHGRRDLGAEQLDRAQHPVVRQRADRELDEEAVVAEELVLEEDLLDHLLRAADEVRAAQRGRRVVVGAASSAPSRARGRSRSSSRRRAGTTRRAPPARCRRCSRAS